MIEFDSELAPADEAPARSTPPPSFRRQSLTDGVYGWLKQLVLGEQLEPGSWLKIEPLARQLGVSQTPVREALARLESDGLVEKESMRGYRVTSLLDARALTRLYELRLLIEPAMARWAATRIQTKDLRRLRDIVDDMTTLTKQGLSAAEPHSYGTYASLDSDFHEVIAHGADNEFLATTLARLRQNLHLARRHFRHGLPPDAANATITEHQTILNALQDHDDKRAEHAMHTHVNNSQQRMLATAHTSPHPTNQQTTETR